MIGLRAKFWWIWLGLVTAASALSFLLGDYQTLGFANAVSAATWLLLPVLYTGLGALIATRSPGNRIAWILLLVGLGVLIDGSVQPLVVEAPVPPGFVDYLALFLSGFMWVVIFFPLFLMLYLFPTGRFLTRRWTWAGWLAAAMVIAFLVVGIFGETWHSPNEDWTLANPIGFIPDSLWDGPFNAIWFLGLGALPVGGFAAMAVRFRRSAIVERTQIKWVLYTSLVLVLAYVATVLSTELMDMDFGDLVIGNLFALSLALLPLSITAAIARYRLFDIDRLISRTVSYTLVVALLAVLFLGIITVATTLMPTQNALAVAGSTLAVTAVFNPFRRRVQRRVDRRFNRSAYQAEVISEQFASRLRQSLTTEELTRVWISTVVDSLQPAASGVWLATDDPRARPTT